MRSNPSDSAFPATAHLEQLVADVDRGARKVGGLAGVVLAVGALVWSLFQLWYASPLPFALGFGILNDTEARALHLGIALFLGYLAYQSITFKDYPVMQLIVLLLSILYVLLTLASDIANAWLDPRIRVA